MVLYLSCATLTFVNDINFFLTGLDSVAYNSEEISDRIGLGAAYSNFEFLREWALSNIIS